MPMHDAFPTDPYVILDPAVRWYPGDALLGDMGGREKLIPPLVDKVRAGVKAWRDSGYAEASGTTRSLLRYWFEEEHLLPQANGTMAQFDHRDLGGAGQWMLGGMTMVGDMFNHGLKAKVDGLCSELSQVLAMQPFVASPASQSQRQGNDQHEGRSLDAGSVSLFVPETSGRASGQWWPADLGFPNGTGAQNQIRYAYFNQAHRLAIELNGHVTVFDHGVDQRGLKFGRLVTRCAGRETRECGGHALAARSGRHRERRTLHPVGNRHAGDSAERRRQVELANRLAHNGGRHAG